MNNIVKWIVVVCLLSFSQCLVVADDATISSPATSKPPESLEFQAVSVGSIREAIRVAQRESRDAVPGRLFVYEGSEQDYATVAQSKTKKSTEGEIDNSAIVEIVKVDHDKKIVLKGQGEPASSVLSKGLGPLSIHVDEVSEPKAIFVSDPELIGSPKWPLGRKVALSKDLTCKELYEKLKSLGYDDGTSFIPNKKPICSCDETVCKGTTGEHTVRELLFTWIRHIENKSSEKGIVDERRWQVIPVDEADGTLHWNLLVF